MENHLTAYPAQELKLDGGEICYNFKEKHLSSFDLKLNSFTFRNAPKPGMAA